MSDTPAPQPEYGADQSLRQRLIKRIALAALAIAALLGGLAVIDRYYVPPPDTPPRTLSASLTPPQPVKPIEPSPPGASPVPAAPEQTSSPSITKSAAGHANEVKPMESAKKAESSRPLAAGAIHPALPARSAATKKMPDEDRPASRAVARHAPPPKPLARKEAQKQYVFQMGVFNDVANAQTLNDKLKEAGVPSRIEARVQVGPFKTRKEAEEARRKLMALGMNPGILAPVKK